MKKISKIYIREESSMSNPVKSHKFREVNSNSKEVNSNKEKQNTHISSSTR